MKRNASHDFDPLSPLHGLVRAEPRAEVFTRIRAELDDRQHIVAGNRLVIVAAAIVLLCALNALVLFTAARADTGAPVSQVRALDFTSLFFY